MCRSLDLVGDLGQSAQDGSGSGGDSGGGSGSGCCWKLVTRSGCAMVVLMWNCVGPVTLFLDGPGNGLLFATIVWPLIVTVMVTTVGACCTCCGRGEEKLPLMTRAALLLLRVIAATGELS